MSDTCFPAASEAQCEFCGTPIDEDTDCPDCDANGPREGGDDDPTEGAGYCENH